jgi:gliding motility-associated-like protein
MRIPLLTLFLFFSTQLFSQNFNFSCAKDIVITGCQSSCVTVETAIPNIYGGGQSTMSVVQGSILLGSCSRPTPVNPDGQGTSAALTIDDRYSAPIDIGFPFSFFGSTYTQLVASANGYLSFDVTLANLFSHYQILNNGGTLSATAGTPLDLPSNLYNGALIMGAYQDLNPAYTTSPTQRIQYSTVGTAPARKFILSYFKVPQFNCNTLIENTQQIILHESGIVEVLIFSRQPCLTWNEGRAMIGMQDISKTQAIMVAGRRASDPPWTVTAGANPGLPVESYIFMPSGPAPGSTPAVSLFKRVELLNLSGAVVSTGTVTATVGNNLQVSFPSVCPALGANTYLVRSVYRKSDNANEEFVGIDTIRLQKNVTEVTANTAVQNTGCGGPTGSIALTGITGTAPFTFSLNGGAFQSSNTFNNLAQGTYAVTVADAIGCTYNTLAVVNLSNNLSLSASPADTSVCIGATISPVVTSNATSFTWTPTTGVSNPNIRNPNIRVNSNTTYTVTATLGTCSAQATVRASVFPGVQVNAGPAQTIILGDQVPLMGSSSQPGTYLWTPSAGLSATNILNPMASPQTTTTYQLRVTTAQGCVDSATTVINVIEKCDEPMSAFTPNGDGINDLWLVTNTNCLRQARVEIFNRYGAKVYESNNYTNNWNGTYKGKPVADGTYYFVVSYRLINGKLVHKRGNVTILR